MSELALVSSTPEPRTRTGLAADLRDLGVRSGDVLLVHSSLKSLGWVAGGEVAVVQALLDAVGSSGTIVVPTQTGGNSDPADWQRPPIPEPWWQTFRDHAPGFDPAITPTRGMGSVAEAIRHWPGAIRSSHPATSLSAVGPAAADLLARHDLDCQLGERSPLAALETAGARVLLLGVGFDVCTAFHLAEYRVPSLPRRSFGSAVLSSHVSGREWATYEDVDIDSDDFELLGAAFEATGSVRVGPVGSGQSRLFEFPAAVEFAVAWLAEHRSS